MEMKEENKNPFSSFFENIRVKKPKSRQPQQKHSFSPLRTTNALFFSLSLLLHFFDGKKPNNIFFVNNFEKN